MKKRYFYCFAAALSLIALISAFSTSKKIVSVMNNNATPFVPTLIIDAGHGGIDGGAVGVDGSLEKEINLSIAKKLASMAKVYGYNVIMTRKKDISIHDDDVTGIRNQKVSDIHNRLKISEDNPGALFISIHQNKFSQSQYWGTQVFYGQNNPESKKIAEIIKNSISDSLQPENTREIKPAQKNLYILYNSGNPAIMVECGFLSNREEA